MPVSAEEMRNSIIQNSFSQMAINIGFTPERILEEQKLIALSDPADYVQIAEGGELSFIPFNQYEPGKESFRRAIRKIKEKTTITESKDGKEIYKTSQIEVDLWDKQEALEFGANVHGMKKPEKIDITINNLADKIRAARERRNAKPSRTKKS